MAAAAPDASVTLSAEHDRYTWLPLEAAAARCLPQEVGDQIRAVGDTLTR